MSSPGTAPSAMPVRNDSSRWKSTDPLESVFHAVYTLPARRGVARTLAEQSKLNARHWQYFFTWWRDCLGTEPTVADLSRPHLDRLILALRASGRPSQSLQLAVRKFIAVWRCLCRANIVAEWPPHPAPFVDPEGNLVWNGRRVWPKKEPAKERRPRQRKPRVQSSKAAPRVAHLALLANELPKVLEPATPLLDLAAVYCRRKLIGANPATGIKFFRACRYLEELLGRSATVADLTEDHIAAVAEFKIQAGGSVATGKEYRAKLQALGQFAFRRGALKVAPDAPPLREPRRVPFAWSVDQLRLLFAAVEQSERVLVVSRAKIPFRIWLGSLLMCMWDSGERLGALMKVQWKHLDRHTGRLVVPAEVRKFRTEDKSFQLHSQTLAAIDLLWQASQPQTLEAVVFPWPHTISTLFRWYRGILKTAGLPHDRKQMFHAVRRTVASYYTAAGGDATRLLGHSSPSVTQVYLSPAIVQTPQPSAILFRPNPGK